MNKYIITIFGECDEKDQLYTFVGTYEEAQEKAIEFKNYYGYAVQTIEEFCGGLRKL